MKEEEQDMNAKEHKKKPKPKKPATKDPLRPGFLNRVIVKGTTL